MKKLSGKYVWFWWERAEWMSRVKQQTLISLENNILPPCTAIL